MFAGQPVYPEFSAANVGEAPDPRTGETVYTAFAGNESDSVGLVVIRDGQRFTVARDWSGLGRDGIKSIVFEMRAAYPRATFETWAPADAHDQWQRVPLVSQLRAERLTPFRGAHTGEARGCLSQRIRTEWRGKRMLMVDRKASITLNALAMGYTYQVERGGRMASSPETGPARLAAEALEAMVQLIERAGDTEPIPRGANVAYTPAGIPYVSSHPGRKP